MIALSTGCARTIRYGQRMAKHESGGFLLIAPGDTHIAQPASTPESMDVMFVEPSIVNRIGTSAGISDPQWRVLTVSDADLARDFETTLTSLRRCAPRTALDAFDVFMRRAITRYCAGDFHRDRTGCNRALVQGARQLLHDQMADRISIKDVAKQLGVTPSHLVRCFTAELGTPPHRYLVHLRVERARALLSNGLSAVDSAHAVGFADQSHLHRHFTRIIGLTPGEYARLVRAHDHSPSPLL